MKFKSALGIAALEELTEDQVPAADDAAVATADDAPAVDTPAADPAPAEGGEAAPAADAVPAEAAPADAPEADAAPAADAPATDDTPADDAAPADAGAGADDAAAASAADSAVGAVDAVGEPAEVVSDAATVDADAEVVEEQMTEVDQLEDKTGDVQEDVEKLEAATEALEGCVSILDAAAQRGGLDIFGASLLRNNVNTVTKSLKVKPLMLPALEDMETPSSKVDGAQTAKEQIVAFIKRIVEAIKSAFVRLGEWMIETYKRLTDAFVALERRAEKLAEKVKTSKMKESAIDSKSLGAKLSVEGKPVEDLAGFLVKLGEYAKYMNDPKSYKVYLDAVDLCEQLVKNPEKEEEIRGQISTTLGKWAEEMSKHACDISAQVRFQTLFSGRAAREGAKITKTFYVALLNNQALIASIPETAEGIRGMNAIVDDCTTKYDGQSVQALDQAAALKICATVAAIAKEIRESGEANKGGVKELVGEIKKRKDTIVAMIGSTTDSMMADAGAGEKTRKVAAFINSVFVTTPNLPVHAINRALPRNLSIALDYVAASIKMTEVNPTGAA